MDRAERLGPLYQEALQLGEELLALLQAPLSDERLAEVERLVDRRAEVAQKAQAIFQPGDQERFQTELAAILRQQRALESQMLRKQEEIQAATDQAQAARKQVQGVQRVLRTGPSPRWIDERR